MIANCGAILASSIPAGIYSTNLSEACHYISSHSKCEVVVVDGNKQLQKYAAMTKPLPDLKVIVLYGEDVDMNIASKCSVPVHSWEEFLMLGENVPESEVNERSAVAKPGNCCTLIYTSGTTGPPKAVMLSHDNVTWTTTRMCEDYRLDLNHNERLVSFLPLSHIAAQLIDIHVPMTLGAATYFAQADALKGSLVNSIKDIRPTVFFGVPRVWEKIQEKMVQVRIISFYMFKINLFD